LKNDELDIWNTEISLSDNDHIEVKPFEHTYEEMTDEQKELLLNSAARVIDNEVLDTNGNHLMYWQTDGLTNGGYSVDKDDDGEYDEELSIFYYCNGFDGQYITSNLTSFSSDLSSLTDGYSMFSYCTKLTSFSSDLSSLTNGISMFNGCENLTSFSSDLSSLTNGVFMFNYCTKLTSFSSDLSSLTNGEQMFCGCYNLTSFTSDLSSLTNGIGMFNGCENLTSFSSNLSSLTNGEDMFGVCSALTSFSSNLSNLMNGGWMFNECKLDAKSLITIIHTLPQREEMPTDEELDLCIGCITIGLGADDTEEDGMLFIKECDYDTPEELLDEISAKNWIVDFQFNGRPTSTYGMRRGKTLPIYTKLEEVIMPTNEKERKPYYAYTSQDGSKFYNIRHFHSTNGSTEGYDVFSSLEEAISTYNVTPKN
jgi:hypothetical protein